MIQEDERRAVMNARFHLLELRRALRPVESAPLRLVKLIDPLVLPFRVEGVRPLRIDCGEADQLIGIDGVAGSIAQRHLEIAGLGGAVLRAAFDRLQLHLDADLL